MQEEGCSYLRHIGRWSSTAGDALGGLSLEETLPEKDIVDLRLRASCSYHLPFPPLPADKVQVKHGSKGSDVVMLKLTGGAPRSAAFWSALELCVSMVKETPSEFPVRDTCILLMLSGKRLDAC